MQSVRRKISIECLNPFRQPLTSFTKGRSTSQQAPFQFESAVLSVAWLKSWERWYGLKLPGAATTAGRGGRAQFSVKSIASVTQTARFHPAGRANRYSGLANVVYNILTPTQPGYSRGLWDRIAMFDTLVLLTGSAEQSLLSPVLRGNNAELRVLPVTTLNDLHSICVPDLQRARLVAFVTDVIVPAKILSEVRYGAFNFHPGPPEYPGWAPAHFALYERAERFGVTLHAMSEHVDAGPIFDIELFPVAARTTVLELEQMTYAHLARMFWSWAKPLTSQAEALTPRTAMRWGAKKNSRRAYRALCDIPLDISQEDLARRMDVFGSNHYGILPSINLHGFEFKAAVPSDGIENLNC